KGVAIAIVQRIVSRDPLGVIPGSRGWSEASITNPANGRAYAQPANVTDARPCPQNDGTEWSGYSPAGRIVQRYDAIAQQTDLSIACRYRVGKRGDLLLTRLDGSTQLLHFSLSRQDFIMQPANVFSLAQLFSLHAPDLVFAIRHHRTQA